MRLRDALRGSRRRANGAISASRSTRHLLRDADLVRVVRRLDGVRLRVDDLERQTR
jgi:hypothetical protein